MSKLGDFDINELILQLHSELKFAFETAQSAEQQLGLRMENVKARFGRKEITEEEGVESKEEDYVEVLNGERYPNEEDWEIEVNYKHGLPIPDIPQSQNWVSSTESQLIIQRLGTTPIIYVKGVNLVWKDRFQKAGISTIEDIALASTKKIQSLCRQYNTLKPLEFQVKVLLLIRDFKPIRHIQYKQISLTTFLGYSQSTIKLVFKNKLTGPEISELKAMASIIYLVFDKRFTSKLKLDILSK